jgi:hypothetical protein
VVGIVAWVVLKDTLDTRKLGVTEPKEQSAKTHELVVQGKQTICTRTPPP